ncbi:putative leader peptide [Streptomyces sp. NBC_00669]|uniref:putative leader peptide n=1 Tax=Streptomyces sp. NBC_00669 TaxID=2976011 RepID=UPI003FA7849B
MLRSGGTSPAEGCRGAPDAGPSPTEIHTTGPSRVPRADVTQPSRVRALPAVRGAHSLAGVRQRTRLVTRVYVDLLRSASALCR